MLRLLIAALVPLLLAGRDWVEFRSGPYQVLTDANHKHARAVLTELEQFRQALGVRLGKKDLGSVWPIRIVVFEEERDRRELETAGILMGRDAFIGGIERGKPVPRQWRKDLGRILLDGNTERMPSHIERGLLELYSTLEVDVTRITIGAPPPEAERTVDWARMHLLCVDDRYSGKVRVLFSNLQQGADRDPAYKNAFEQTPAEVDKEVAAYLSAGNFGTTSISGLAINPERDFPALPVEESTGELALADLHGRETAKSAYAALLGRYPSLPGALEGLGRFQEAVEAGSRSPRALLEAGRPQEAVKANPRWAEPHVRMARAEAGLVRKAELLKAGAEAEPRNAVVWEELARTYLEAKNFTEAGHAWTAAARAAAEEEDQRRYEQARREIEKQRVEYEAAERRRLAEERERELQKLRDQALAKIRAAETKANQGGGALDPAIPVVEWFEGEQASAKAYGLLQRVDCIEGQARLVVQADTGRIVQVLIRDPAKVVISGGGEKTLGCGPQRRPRRVVVDYVVRVNNPLSTAGDAKMVEFQE